MNENAQSLKPNPKYLTKMRVIMVIIAVLILLGGALLSWLISLDQEGGAGGAQTVFMIIAGLDVLWWLPAMLLTAPYYRSLHYEIQDDEVIMHVGIWTQSVKHVPYRTVTNLTVKRDILDRWLDIGALDIQTAGMSGSSTAAEESLVGLSDVQAVYEMVAAELRRFRGSMAPTAAEVETASPVDAERSDVLQAILDEVQAIRQSLP